MIRLVFSITTKKPCKFSTLNHLSFNIILSLLFIALPLIVLPVQPSLVIANVVFSDQIFIFVSQLKTLSSLLSFRWNVAPFFKH